MNRKISGSLQLSRQTKKINLATPAYSSSFSAEYVSTLYRLLTKKDVKLNLSYSLSHVDYADIVESRNYLISNFYFNKTDCDYILFMDADMGFGGRLIERMVETGGDVVGVIAPKRSISLDRLHSASERDFQTAYADACDFIGKPTAIGRDGFFKVDRVGTGILLISRSCVRTLISECDDIRPEYGVPEHFKDSLSSFITPFNKIVSKEGPLSEDLSFCYRWVKMCGGEIVANGDEPVTHVGRIGIRTAYTESSQV